MGYRPTRPLQVHAVPAVLAMTLVLGACGDDEPADDTAAEDAEDTELAEDPTDDAAETEPAVVVRGQQFDPATLVVPVGTTVTWTNEDSVDHTVTAGAAGEPDGTFDEPLGADGGAVELGFDEAGTVVYHCTIHPAMVGRIEVQ
jgi:plastocyanin